MERLRTAGVISAAAPATAWSRSALWPSLATALVFILSARGGYALQVPGTNVGAFWPPAGLSIAALLFWGIRAWPGIALGAAIIILPDLVSRYPLGVALGTGLGEVVADVIPPVLGVWAAQRALRGADPLARAADLFKLILWTGPVAQGLAATMGLAAIWAGGMLEGPGLGAVWLSWFVSNVSSVALLVPCCLAWRHPWPLERPLRHLAVLGASLLSALLVFFWIEPGAAASLRYMSFLVVLGAAFWLGARGATLAALLHAAVAVWATVLGRGAFTQGPVAEQVVLLGFYVGTIGLTGLALSTVLAERTRAEAQEEALRQQLAQAQRIESMGRLAGGVAHDLNNLLSPVLSFAGILLEDAPPGSQLAEDLREIQRAAERARDLTRQLLALGRKQVLDIRTVDLGAELRRFERLLRLALREDVRLELRIPPALGPVRADVGQLEQVVMNLALNAQQAMPGGGLVSVELADVVVDEANQPWPGLQPGAWVRLTLADSGTGMEPAVLERIFEPFFTTRRRGEGTGLGLSIVHGIVGQHRGHVFATSEPGRGSTFQVYLPRADDAAPVEPAPPPAVRAAPGVGTILVAEDEAGVRHVAVRVLRRLGYRVLEASGGLSCLALAAGEPGRIDLLLTDVVMPDLDGRRLHDRLEALRPGLPVLYMSGYAGEVVTHHGVLEGGGGFIQKPFTPEELTAAVRRALGVVG